MYRLPCAELCSCQFLFINHVSDCQKLFCLQVYFRANSYRYLRIEFQKEDKLTHRRYAPSFERITQWVDKVGQYISVINLGSRYLHGPSAGRKTKMIELVIKMVRAQVDANPKRSLTHSTHGLRMKKSTVHNMLIYGFKLKPYLINILHSLSRADPVKPEVISNWLLDHPQVH